MSEWWTYSLTDFLLFSPRAYYALIERYNRAVWPLHLVATAAGLAMSIALARPDRRRIRLGAAALGAAWIWIGWAFMWERYLEINWAAAWIAGAFILQGALLSLYAAIPPSPPPAARSPFVRSVSVSVFVIALGLYPMLAPVTGRAWQSAEILGIAPDPTASATLAWLATATAGASRWLMAIPVLWCALTGATLWALGSPDFFVAPACAFATLAAAVVSSRQGLLRQDRETHR